jgi:hypothetical protein
VDLARDGEYPQAALEFRRLAMEYEAANERGTFAWLAGYAYWQAGRYWQAERMINITEDVAPSLETEIYLLRAGNNRSWRRPDEAAFYLETLRDESREEPGRRLATLQLAAVKVEDGKLDAARDLLVASPFGEDAAAIAAIDLYSQGRDKNLVVGGLLGLVPGLGYAYSGEYANALRSLILNSLCIWGVVEFADREQWGGVAVVGFAGVTFYSGSIYGGADAAARYNRRRREACTQAIEKNGRIPFLWLIRKPRLVLNEQCSQVFSSDQPCRMSATAT